MNVAYSESEESGLRLVPPDALEVYSVGISTGGIAEMRMARENPARHIIATTIDVEGAAFAGKLIEENGLESQIEVKIEDVSKPLSYPDEYFDFIYARLVLHYLKKTDLDNALKELGRVMVKGSKLFIVVRSNETPDATDPTASFNPYTRLTTNTNRNEDGSQYSYSRYFHDIKSITEHCENAGFQVSEIKQYDEKLFKDFMRVEPADNTDNIIELVATK